ncbi:TolB family protein [Streptomyces sp. NPDC127098]|uniref:TolB family protein n=1 Tax=Streptomyces sp. NPDC127098 TaxID=3347137 RepID=UPI00365C487A
MAVRHLCAPGDLDTRRPLPGRPAHAQRVAAVAASDGLRRVAVATTAPWFHGLGELLVLDTESGGPPLRLPPAVRRPHPGLVRDLLLTPDGGALTVALSGTEEQHVGQLAHWTLEGPAERWRRSLGRARDAGLGDCLRPQLAASADGSTLACADRCRHAVLALAAADGRRLTDPPANAGSPAVALDPAGGRLAYPAQGGIAVLDLATGHTEARTAGLDWCGGLAFSPDGSTLAVVGEADGAAMAVLIAPGHGIVDRRALGPLPGDARRQILRPVWGAAGARAAVRTGRTVTVWDLLTARPLHAVPDLGRSTAWSLATDGRALVVATTTEIRAHVLEPSA